MNSRNMILMGLAVGCGLVAAFLTASLGGPRAEVKLVDMWVAKINLDQGTLITKDKLDQYLTKKQVVEVPENVINDPEKLVNMRLNRSRRKGEPFYPEDLTRKEGLVLPEGMFGLALRVSAEQMSGGFVLPNSHVDILLTENVKGKIVSNIILRSIKVIAVDVLPRRLETVEAIAQPTTVTLAVTPKQAQIISVAKKRGELSFILRSDDAVDKDLDEVTPVDSLPHDKKGEEMPRPPTPVVEKIDVVIALKDADAGEEITKDNINEYFAVKQFDKETPLPSERFADLEDLKERIGEKKALTRPIYENTPVCSRIFEPTAVVKVEPKKEEKVAPQPKTKTSTLVIQNGPLSRPEVHIFRDGSLIGGVANRNPSGSGGKDEESSNR